MDRVKQGFVVLISFVLFCFWLNVELTNKIHNTHLIKSNIETRTFDSQTTVLELTPWFNPLLNGQYVISTPSKDYLLIKTTDKHFVAANKQSLILLTLFSPINFFIIFLFIAVNIWFIRKEQKFNYYKQKLRQLNTQTQALLDSFNIQTHYSENTNTYSISHLSNAISLLENHIANHLKQTQTTIFQDKLTQLIDRHAYIDHIQRLIINKKNTDLHCALLFIDLDGFKQINDSFGHSFGDEILVQVANRLENVLRNYKLSNINETNKLEQNLARLGGDEFSIFVEHVDNNDRLFEIAQNVLNEIEKDFVMGNKIVKISASIGIAAYPESASTPESLLQLADVAMYRAKNDGKGIFKVYSPEMGHKMRRYHYLLEELRVAVAQKDFYMVFQPIVNVEDCMIDYFEALIRWEHPTQGMISPIEFIPIAEGANLILDLGDWIMLESCRQMAAWHNAGMKKVKVSVNVSGVQLKHRPIYDWVMSKLIKTGLPAHSLMLEITESTFIKADQKMIDELKKLQLAGVKIAIDDFGTGFSSLSTLADLPIDVIKIDRSFIMQSDKNEKYRDILKTISELGKKLGLKIVAEGVEEVEQFEFVKNIGISAIQGYVISPPESSINVGNKVLSKNMSSLSAFGSCSWGIDPSKYDM
jgi:diguanylate cyclase (GGDEF)-like protein